MAEADRNRANDVARLNRFLAWVGSDAYQLLNAHHLLVRLERGNTLFNALEASHAEAVVAAANNQDRAALDDQLVTLEERYLTACGTVRERIDELTAPAAADNNANAAAAVRQPINVRLPLQHQTMRPTWGKFDGSPLKWIEFKQRFSLSVHDNADVPTSWKYTYLKEALVGEPAGIIGSGPLDEQGYNEAWDKLCGKYEEKYPLACHYLNDLYRLKALQEGCTAGDIQNLSNVASETHRQLRQLGYPVDHWDLIFVHVLHARLGPYSGKWEDKRGRNDEPTMKQMVEFLELQASKVQTRGLVHQQSLQITVDNPAAYRPPPPPSSHTRASSSMAAATEIICACCGTRGHKIFDCQEFLPMTIKERQRVADQMALCKNCLKPGHSADHCWDKRVCKLPACKFNNKHNSLLCPNKVMTHYGMYVNSSNPPGGSNADVLSSRGGGRGYKRSGHSS